MTYPKAPFCPSNTDDAKNLDTAKKRKNSNVETPRENTKSSDSLSQNELMNLINELSFAVTDLNLFLDTHPNDEEALKTFTILAATLKSYKHDYAQKFGTLYATDSSDKTPFEWVGADNKWPWQM